MTYVLSCFLRTAQMIFKCTQFLEFDRSLVCQKYKMNTVFREVYLSPSSGKIAVEASA